MASLLYVVNDPAFFLTHRAPVARAARQAGHQVAVAGPPGADADRVESAGFPYHAIPLTRRSLAPHREVAAIRAIRRLYVKERPDLVHHVTIKPVVYGGIAARRAGVPAVVNAVTGLGWVFLAKGARASVARAVAEHGYRLALRHKNQLTVFQNHDDRTLFTDRGLVEPRQTRIVRGSGVDPDAWPLLPPATEGPPLVVLPARLLWDKGVGTFVAAARRLHDMDIPGRFALVGAPDPGNRSSVPADALEGWARDGIVEPWGHRTDMLDVYRQAAVVCLPSRREGVPRALIEAASCGRAVVTTDAPGCREIVDHGRNGLLVPPDDPDALARALSVLLRDPAIRDRMGRAGRAKVMDGFTEAAVVRDTLTIYSEVLGAAEGPARTAAPPPLVPS